MTYLKDKQYSKSIEILRQKKWNHKFKGIIKEEERKIRNVFEAAKRHYRSMIYGGQRFKLTQYDFLGLHMINYLKTVLFVKLKKNMKKMEKAK